MTTSIERIKGTLQMLKNQLVANRYLRWWVGELVAMLPEWIHSANINAQSFLIVPLEQATAQWAPTDASDTRDLALTLPLSRVLRKTLKLPLATEENLRQVLEFQMEQHTPFSSNQVYFGWHVIERNFEGGHLTVEFIATPRDVIDVAIKMLSGSGATVRAAFAEDMLTSGSLVNLLPIAPGKTPFSLKHGAIPWLALLAGLLALTAVGFPLVVKREAVRQMLPWVEKGKKAAETVDTMRHELEARVDQHNFLLEKRKNSPAVIQVLEELTRVLPDDTWVQVLDIKGKELQIQGETASSVRLIGLFESSSMFREASFRAPLTKGQVSGSERYQLALQIQSAPKPETAVAQPAALSPTQTPEKKP